MPFRRVEFDVSVAPLHAMTQLVRAQGLDALFSPSAYRVCRGGADPRLRLPMLRRTAARSADPRLKMAALESRGDVIPFRRPGPLSPDETMCGACGFTSVDGVGMGSDPSRCAGCSAFIPGYDGSRSATRRTTTNRSRDPRLALLELRRHRIQGGW